jgi:Flp pilus assembly protein TadG
MTIRSFKSVRSDARGQSTVEFSLSALMLILMMLGVFEMSRMLLIYNTVDDAARAGERYEIVHGVDDPATTSQVQTVVKNFLSAAPMSTGNATITVTGAGGAIGFDCSVSVTYPYDPWVGFYVPFLSINISSVARGIIVW